MKKAFALLVVLLLSLSVPLVAQDKSKKERKEVTLKGEIVDVSCYIHEGVKGEGHKDCGVNCAKNGWPLGILTKDGELYVSIAAMGFNCVPNTELMGYIGHQVEVKGYPLSKGGVNGIGIASVKMAK